MPTDAYKPPSEIDAPPRASASDSVQSPPAARALATRNCFNCGAALGGPYCAECGQRDVHEHEWSLRHFCGHLWHELTHLDAKKILRTLGALLFRPGLLSEAYLNGQRLRFVGPLRVYLVTSALFFFAVWTSMLTSYGYRSNPAIQQGTEFMAQARQQPVELYREHFNQNLDRFAGLLWFLGVFLIGLILLLLFRPARPYYVQHLIVALHLVSFDFFMRSGGVLLATIAEATDVPLFYHGLWATYLLFLAYAYVVFRRIYRQGVGLTLAKAGVFLALTLLVVFLIMWGATILAFRFT